MDFGMLAAETCSGCESTFRTAAAVSLDQSHLSVRAAMLQGRYEIPSEPVKMAWSTLPCVATRTACNRDGPRIGSRNHAATALRVAAAKIPKFVQYLFLAVLWFVLPRPCAWSFSLRMHEGACKVVASEASKVRLLGFQVSVAGILRPNSFCSLLRVQTTPMKLLGASWRVLMLEGHLSLFGRRHRTSQVARRVYRTIL